MNGETGFACRLTAAAKSALKGGEFSFEKMPYENKTTFLFEKRNGADSGVTADSAAEWFARLKEYGAEHIFLMMPYVVQDRRALGFANANPCTIFVRFADGTTSRFAPRWVFDNENRRWDITIYEELMPNAPAEMPSFKDNTSLFKKALSDIRALAEKLGFEQFAEFFKKGYDVLDGGEMPENLDQLIVPKLSEKQLRMYLAADISDVFGAMGSWNDTPGVVAHNMGLTEEYSKLSQELYAQNRLALMYAINEE